MTKDVADETPVPILGSDWFDPLEAGVRRQLRSLSEGLLEEELTAALKRTRDQRGAAAAGHRNGHRERQVLGTFGAVTVSVPRARRRGRWPADRVAQPGSCGRPAPDPTGRSADRGALIAER